MTAHPSGGGPIPTLCVPVASRRRDDGMRAGRATPRLGQPIRIIDDAIVRVVDGIGVGVPAGFEHVLDGLIADAARERAA